jgi:hypothetical protein
VLWDRLRLDADPDPDPVEKSQNCLTFIHSIATLHCFVFLVSAKGVIFNILDSVVKFSGKKHSLALHLVKTYTDPDPALAPDPPK